MAWVAVARAAVARVAVARAAVARVAVARAVVARVAVGRVRRHHPAWVVLSAVWELSRWWSSGWWSPARRRPRRHPRRLQATKTRQLQAEFSQHGFVRLRVL
ncbi:MAG: hypothetical protein OXU22_01190 [Gammaproteobacteria bacterium]|nr:hypothetical protein [Gammaproteobacteria bacterium]